MCTQIGNDNFRGDAFTSVSLPVCTQIGNDNFIGDAFTSVSLPVCTQIGNYNFRGDAFTSVHIGKHHLNIKIVDYSCYVIESKKTTKGINLYTGYNLLSIEKGVIQKQVCYVAEKDNYTAHGDTPKKAITDLQFKIVAEKLKNEPIKADTLITVNHYRLITGACEMGVKSWIEQNKLTGHESMRADELLPLLVQTNAYGIERFKQLITF